MSYADNPRVPGGNPPSSESAPQEATGAIASDSLAAESLEQGGDFASGDAVPSSQKGASSTFNTTDTSGATALHAARDASTRDKQDALGLGDDEKGSAGGLKYPDAAGQPEFTGRHNLDGYTGGPSADQRGSGYATQQPAGGSDFGSTAIRSGDGPEGPNEIRSGANYDDVPGSVQQGSTTAISGATSGAGIRPHVDAAPNYAARVSGAIEDEGYGKPKGNNLTEGGIPQTKTFTGNVGGAKDPGRLAEREFEKINQDSAGSGASGRDYSEGASGGQYDVLSNERA